MSMDAALESPGVFASWQEYQEERGRTYSRLLNAFAEARKQGDTEAMEALKRETDLFCFGPSK